jgi:hypothetical protein
MILRYEQLRQFPRVFRSMTGLSLTEFDALVEDLLPRFRTAEQSRAQRPGRRRAPGGGRPFELAACDQFLATVVWLRHYPTQEVLAYLFGVSDSTVLRVRARVLPLLEASGRDTMRMPDPGKAHRKTLDALLRETPELAVVIDSFEQRVQRPRAPKNPKDRKPADAWYSGKKKQHTVKSQVAVEETTGSIVDIADSVVGPTADIKLLEASGLLQRLPAGVGGLGDLAYVGLAALHPEGLGATPRRKPRGKPRPEEDSAYNRAFARRRVVVEHSIRRLRSYQALSQTDRHHRCNHSRRVRAVAGLVNRQIRHRLAS